MREARLRPEFAHLYPGLTPGRWEPASRIAEAVLANVLLHQMAEAPHAQGRWTRPTSSSGAGSSRSAPTRGDRRADSVTPAARPP